MGPQIIIKISDVGLAKRLGATEIAHSRRAIAAVKGTDIILTSGADAYVWPMEESIALERTLIYAVKSHLARAERKSVKAQKRKPEAT